MLNMRKLLKIPYLFDNLMALMHTSSRYNCDAEPVEQLKYHKKDLSRQLIHDIFRDFNWNAKK